MNLKSRLIIIFALVAASVWALYPRTVVQRVQRNGAFVYDTVKHVPLKLGLDLQGGVHMTLEIDESKGVQIKDKADALDRALKVVRNRIDEFGVAEPVVQKVGNDRIIVELPGILDPRRAEAVVQNQAFLEFQITDKTQALDRVATRIDAILKDKKFTAAPGTNPSAADTSKEAGLKSLFVTDSTKGVVKDTTKAAKDSAADTAKAQLGTGGSFTKLLLPSPSQTPG